MSVFMFCAADAPGAQPVKGHDNLWINETFKGAVVYLRERNGYDDSDFLALVWDEAQQKAYEVCYASTRGWTYPCHAEVDASPEVKAKALAYTSAVTAAREAQRREEEILPGDIVRLSLKAGKNKSRNGQEAEVFWKGLNSFNQYRPEVRFGVRFEDGTKLYFSAQNVVKVRTVELA